MTSDPFFSVIVPTYQRAHLIEKTIFSVLQQTFEDFELIIVDDGSTDDTSEVLARQVDPRVSYLHITNGERGRARNEGVKKAKGKFVYFLDSDDLLYPHHLSTANRYLADDPDILWLPYEHVDTSGHVTRPYRPISKDAFDTLVEEGNFMSCHGVFVKRGIMVQHPFNEDRVLAGSEDMELWMRLTARYPIVIGSEVTSSLVEHDDRSVMSFDAIDSVIRRKQRMLSYLLTDEAVVKRLNGREGRLRANSESYIALHAMIHNETPSKVGWKYFLRAIGHRPQSIFSKRSLAILKHGMLRILR